MILDRFSILFFALKEAQMILPETADKDIFLIFVFFH